MKSAQKRFSSREAVQVAAPVAPRRGYGMGSYEGRRQIRQGATIGTLLTPLMWQGNFSQTTAVVRDPANNNTPPPGSRTATSSSTSG